MRENKSDRKNVSVLYSEYIIKGFNLDRFINTVKKRGIGLYDIKKLNDKCLTLRVNLKESEKFFAIAEELCYNVKKVGEGGVAYPLIKGVRNLGFVLGAVLFILLSVFVNDFVFAFSFSGTGSIVKTEVEQYLQSNGISVYSRFSQIDLAELEDDILASNDKLSFVSCKKEGNRLCIELVLSDENTGVLTGKATELRSNVSGVVEQIKVYRGTAEVSVGDTVKEGDLLVDGYAVIKEERIEENVIASVTIRTNSQFEYHSERDNDEQSAIVFAEELLNGKEILDFSVEKIEKNGIFIYKVELIYRSVLSVG